MRQIKSPNVLKPQLRFASHSMCNCLHICGLFSGLTVCYVGSAPWILNASLQENILFGQPLEKKRCDLYAFVFEIYRFYSLIVFIQFI